MELSTIIVNMEMLVVTRGSMTSLYCQYEACGREDMKIPEETDDTNDHDDISVAWPCQRIAINLVAEEPLVIDSA